MDIDKYMDQQINAALTRGALLCEIELNKLLCNAKESEYKEHLTKSYQTFDDFLNEYINKRLARAKKLYTATDYKNALIRIKELADASANTPEYKELQRIKELVHHYEKQHPEVEEIKDVY